MKTNQVNTEKQCIKPPTSINSKISVFCVNLLNIEADYTGRLAVAQKYLQHCDNDIGEDFSWSADLQGNQECDFVERLLSYLKCASEPSLDTGLTDENERRFVLTQYAPQAMLSGCVLQNFANASNCHESIASYAHIVHSWYVGNGTCANSHALLYRNVLGQADIHLPSLGSHRFSDKAKLLPSSWLLPAYSLSLAQFPRQRELEILGVALLEVSLTIPILVQKALPDSSAYNKKSQGKERVVALNAALALRNPHKSALISQDSILDD